ncbi:MAG: M48 family metalloprotease [Gemmatimonadetes bacterium]|nr:M48 family metalloprotease [Gemmatimonadota bacterium]MYG34236.1 M48 family metalloprotease [Gemmatimonadota bacterium]
MTPAALVFVVVTAIGIVTLVLVRALRPDRQARGLTELGVLLAAYGAVYGPVGAGLVTLNEIDPDLSHLPPFVAGALMGASLAILVVGGIGLAMALALWVLRRPVELPSKRLGARWFLLLVVGFAVLFGAAMPVFGTMEDRSAVFAWAFTGLFYIVFWLAHSFLLPWLTFLRSPRLAESPESGGLQSWVDEVMARQGKRPVPVRVHEGGLVNAFVLWGIRKPWLLVGEGLLKALSPHEVRAVLAHEIAHIVRGDHVRLLFSGVAWAVAITVCSQLVIVPLFAADRPALAIAAITVCNMLYFVALGVMMRRVEHATDLLAVDLLGGRGEPLASALEKMALVKRASAKQKGMMHPSVQNRVEAIRAVSEGSG